MEYGLIGEKLGHSYSAEIHSAIGKYDYTLKEIPRDEIEAFFKKKCFKGINVTIPYKEEVMKYLDEIDPAALEIGAVNTVCNREGKLCGYNTDFIGMKKLIEKTGVDLKGKKVMIAGSGGTSKTASAVAKALGASSVIRLSRTERENCISYAEAEEKGDAEFFINATPCGMYPNLFSQSIDINKFPQLLGMIDAVYNPLRTRSVLKALSKNIPAEGGLYMLVVQAVAAAELFTESEISDAVIDEIYKKLLFKKENIIVTDEEEALSLAEKLSRPLYRAQGNLKELAAKTSAVILLKIKDEENILLANGRIYNSEEREIL